MAMDRFEVTTAGFGGQGVVTIGRLLAEAATRQYKHVFYFPSYSTEQRGGNVACTTVITNDELGLQPRYNIPAAILLSPTAMAEMEKRMEPGGMMFVNSSMIPGKVSREDIKAFYIPATKAALEMGERQIANFILLGACLKATKAIPFEDLEEALDKKMAGKEHLLSMNKKALRKGADLIANYQ